AGRKTTRTPARMRWPGCSACTTIGSAAGGRSRTAKRPGGRTMGAMEEIAASNREATEAWSGPLFERFVRFRDLVSRGLGAHGEEAMRVHPPAAGARVLDVGCGFGDTTQRLAELVGPDGEAVGVDVSEPFVAMAREEAAEAGTQNVSFRCGDVQTMDLGEG